MCILLNTVLMMLKYPNYIRSPEYSDSGKFYSDPQPFLLWPMIKSPGQLF